MKEFNPYKCVSKAKYELRPAHKGVFHADGVKVGLDGHILVVVKSEYPAELEGKVVGKDGTIINERYPMYRSAIPRLKGCVKYVIDTDKLSEAIAMAEIQRKSNRLTYIATTDAFNIRICHAKLMLSFLKTYKAKEVYIDIPKNKNHLSTMQVRSGDNIILCTSIDGNVSEQTIINNNITTK